MLRSCLRPPEATCLGMVLGAGTVAAVALTTCITSAATLAVGPGTCGQTGRLSGATTCIHTVVGSDTYRHPRSAVLGWSKRDECRRWWGGGYFGGGGTSGVEHMALPAAGTASLLVALGVAVYVNRPRVAIVGHVDSAKGPSVFLPRMHSGLGNGSRQPGPTAPRRSVRSTTLHPSPRSLSAPAPSTVTLTTPRLRLITCGGSFDRATGD